MLPTVINSVLLLHIVDGHFTTLFIAAPVAVWNVASQGFAFHQLIRDNQSHLALVASIVSTRIQGPQWDWHACELHLATEQH